MRYSRIVRNVIASIIIANILILIGKENWLDLYQSPLHYLDMGVTFISVLIIFEYVDWINRYLNKQLMITGNLFRRIILQVLLGITLPALMAIFFTFIMWEFLWSKSLIEGNYFKYEFFPQLLIIIVVNLFFIILDLFGRIRSKEPRVTIIAQKGTQKVPVYPDDILMIKLKTKTGLLYIILSSGEQLLLTENLETIQRKLSDQDFFRANRQVIFNRKACKSFRSAKNGKILVELNTDDDSVVVSQKRASDFRSWIR
jgi:hypothetical protein